MVTYDPYLGDVYSLGLTIVRMMGVNIQDLFNEIRGRTKE